MIESIPIYKMISKTTLNLFNWYNENDPRAEPMNIDGVVITRQNNNPSQKEQKPLKSE